MLHRNPDRAKETLQYFSAHAFLNQTPELPDLVVKLIWPATEVHIRKYTAQPRFMVHETPKIYQDVVVPYIESFPPERLDWYVQP
jgi:m7GpppX diphosphatase